MRKQTEEEKFEKSTFGLVIALIVYILCLVAGIKYCFLQPVILKYANDAIGVLRGIYLCGWIAGIFILIGNIIYIRYCYKYMKMYAGIGLLLVFICSFMVIFFDYAILIDYKYVQKMSIINEEINNVKNERCITREVYLKESETDDSNISLMFYDDDSEKVKTYQVAADADNIGGLRDKIYVPDCLSFSLDEKNPYGDSMYVEANKAYAAVYRVTYTPNLNLVVDVETLPPREPSWNIVELDGLEAASGYNKTMTSKENLSWNNNESHIEFKTGETIDFSWTGPRIMGSEIGAGENQILFTYNDTSYKHELSAFVICDYNDETYDAIKSMSKVEWTEKMHIPYRDGIYEIEEYENYLRVLVEIESDIKKGYALYIYGKNEEAAYGFAYTEDCTSYNEKRAKKIIDSILLINSFK